MKNFNINRRSLIKGLAAGLLYPLPSARSAETVDVVMTVLGPIQPVEMGVTLPHEHVLVDFIGWKETGKHRWKLDDVCPVVLPHLAQLKQLGCKTLVECSPNFIGRDPALLKRLSTESGLNILTNTGLYAAANEKFVPDYARIESADQLAKRWTQESEEGIDGTSVKPGFIKIGVKNGPLNEIDQKLVRAACLTHKETGLAIACHSGGNGAIADEMRILKEEGVRGDALVWVHAQNEQDADLIKQAIDFGVWVSYDKVNHNSMEKDIARALQYKQQGALSNLHLSHDAGWYSPGQENGGDFRPFDAIFTALLPTLKDNGFTDDEIKQITQINPQQAFTIQKRLL